jgi:hypothetical protein
MLSGNASSAQHTGIFNAFVLMRAGDFYSGGCRKAPFHPSSTGRDPFYELLARPSAPPRRVARWSRSPSSILVSGDVISTHVISVERA